MSLTSSINSLQQPHQHDWSSAKSHDRPSDPHGGEVSTLSAPQQVVPDVADPGHPVPPRPPGSPIHAGADSPGWKRLICSPLVRHEQLSLITTIFSNRDEVEVVKCLRGDEAQDFIDAVYEARSHLISSLRMCPLT